MTALTDLPDILPDSVHTPAPSTITFLLWSNSHQEWWAPDARGYTPDRDEAGRYTQAQAVEHVVNSAMGGLLGEVTCMVAVHENWGGR